jgi:hypothetical protein
LSADVSTTFFEGSFRPQRSPRWFLPRAHGGNGTGDENSNHRLNESAAPTAERLHRGRSTVRLRRTLYALVSLAALAIAIGAGWKPR